MVPWTSQVNAYKLPQFGWTNNTVEKANRCRTSGAHAVRIAFNVLRTHKPFTLHMDSSLTYVEKGCVCTKLFDVVCDQQRTERSLTN